MKVKFNGQISRSIYLLALFLALILLFPPIKSFFSARGERWLYIMSISFAFSFCLTSVFRSIAVRQGVLDKPSTRKIHREATPLLGGVAVFVAFFIGIVTNGIYSAQLFAILCGAAMVFIVGLVDDFRDVSASIKLLVQILSTALVLCFGIILRVFPESLGPFAQVGNAALTLLWIVGITNAMNFFDGMDGMAAGLAAIISFFLGMLAFLTDQPFLGWISVAMMGSCLGFLPYNFRIKGNASIFLGDAGSTVIGFILACLAVYGDWAVKKPVVSLVSPLLIFWVMIFDMVHITVDRILTGKVSNLRQWIEYVGMDHLHHRLAEVLGDPKWSVLFIYLLSISLGTSAIVLRYAKSTEAILLLLQASIIVIIVTVLERRGRSLSNAIPKTRACDECYPARMGLLNGRKEGITTPEQSGEVDRPWPEAL